jgi:UDP-glucose 4-epimerase
MSWLVTGGAGYIGSHVVKALLEAGLDPVVIDDLSTGHEAFVPEPVPFVRGSVLDGELVLRTLERYQVSGGVIHIAGFKFAGESVKDPLRTYQQNVTGTATLLAAMESFGANRIVFSSSAAVYGTPHDGLVTEQTAKAPESPYGESKLIGEWLMRDQAIAHGLAHTSLRYFNVVGSGDPSLYDSSPHNLLPRVFAALLDGQTPQINGNDYDTPDGTPVRDYIHVSDVAAAHVAAAKRLAVGDALEPAYNLGSGSGSSVGQIMAEIASATSIEFTPEIASRRPGDPATIVASGELATRDLQWSMRHTLSEMVSSQWKATRRAAQPSD